MASPTPPPSPALSFLVRCALAAVLFGMVAAPSPAAARPSADAYDRAVSLRTQLEATPAEQRTRTQYEDVLNAFRAIYHQAPNASKSPAAVAAVADLLAERGRVLKDQRSLRAAIGQYEFLREQYPDSPQIENALLLEGEICRQDLKDAACAEEKFRAVVEEQPGTSFAEQATLELQNMQAEAVAASKAAGKADPKR